MRIDYKIKNIQRGLRRPLGYFLLSALFTQGVTSMTLLPQGMHKLRYVIDKEVFEKDVVRNDNYYIFLDQDGDGLPDAMDHDLDGDGYDNIIDEFPDDASSFGSDRNENGINDFVDFHYSANIITEEKAEAAALQEEIFDEYQVLIIPSVEMEIKQVRLVKELLDIGFTDTTNNLKYVIFETTHPTNWLTKGEYEKDWKKIVIYKDQFLNDDELNLTLTHEFFHFVHEENPDLYKSFLKAVGWQMKGMNYVYQHNADASYPIIGLSEAKLRLGGENLLLAYDNFPSEYSTISPEEMFAEVATAYLYQDKRFEASFSDRFNNYNDFSNSKAFEVFEELFSIY